MVHACAGGWLVVLALISALAVGAYRPLLSQASGQSYQRSAVRNRSDKNSTATVHELLSQFEPHRPNLQASLQQLRSGHKQIKVLGTDERMSQDGRRLEQTGKKRDLKFGLMMSLDYKIGDAQEAYLENVLMPAVHRVIARSIRVRNPPPDIDVEVLTYGTWNDDFSAIEAFDDYVDVSDFQAVDMILEVITLDPDNENCGSGSTVAFAAPYAFELPSYRPAYGVVFICHLDPNPVVAVEALVHETLHSMGFVSSVFPYFKGGLVVDSSGPASMVVTPMVSKMTAAHLSCDELSGAYLESSGGQGTAGSHWENRIYHGELMQASVKNLGHVNRIVLTDLTLALLQDSGWYDVRYGTVGFDPYGYGAGCTLATGTYEEALADPAAARYLCQPEQLCPVSDIAWTCDQSTSSDSAYNSCLKQTLDDQCNTCVSDFSATGLCVNAFAPADEEFLKAEMIMSVGSTDCQTSPGSRCFLDGNGGTCADMSCAADGSLVVNGSPCVGERCPDADLMCGDPGLLTCLGTLNDCSGHGDCFKGKCYCHLGFGGEDCSQFVCLDRCLDGSPCPVSGFCGQATCGDWSDGDDGVGTPCKEVPGFSGL